MSDDTFMIFYVKEKNFEKKNKIVSTSSKENENIWYIVFPISIYFLFGRKRLQLYFSRSN